MRDRYITVIPTIEELNEELSPTEIAEMNASVTEWVNTWHHPPDDLSTTQNLLIQCSGYESDLLTPLVNRSGNPILTALDQLLFRCQLDVKEYIWQRLTEMLGEISENFRASTAELFQLVDKKELNPIITHNTCKPLVNLTTEDKEGIVAHVARTGSPYFTNNVEKDELYVDNANRAEHSKTRSEIAVPLIFSRTKEVLGVVNLESIKKDAFSVADLEELQAKVGSMVSHLLILRSIQAQDESWLPWHPDLFGWDLSILFQKLCHTVAASIDPDGAKCSIWYMDWAKKQLFVYASSGYDIEYKYERILPIESFMGIAVTQVRGTVLSIDPQSDPRFIRKEKAHIMGMTRALACPIWSPKNAPDDYGISAVNIYLNRKENDTPEVREALQHLADVIGTITDTFEKVRGEFAEAKLHHLLYEKPVSSESDFEVLRDFFKEVFQADGCSIFARQANENKLYCATTTGLDTSRAGQAESLPKQDQIYYNLDEDKGFTVFLCQRPEHIVRFNNLLDPDEEGLPAGLPNRPLLKYRENFSPRNDDNRRLLGTGISLSGQRGSQPPDTLGVIRLLRKPRSKPFTPL